MKTTKIAIAVTLGVLFVAGVNAATKGKPAGLTFVAACNTNDVCELKASGLAPLTSYVLDITDNCGASDYDSGVTASATGTIHLFYGPFPESSSTCTVTSWTFTLIGSRNKVVASFTATDNGTD